MATNEPGGGFLERLAKLTRRTEAASGRRMRAKPARKAGKPIPDAERPLENALGWLVADGARPGGAEGGGENGA